MKFSCPHCGQHIEAEADYAGMEADCPSCSGKLTVPHPPPGSPPILPPAIAHPIISQSQPQSPQRRPGLAHVGFIFGAISLLYTGFAVFQVIFLFIASMASANAEARAQKILAVCFCVSICAPMLLGGLICLIRSEAVQRWDEDFADRLRLKSHELRFKRGVFSKSYRPFVSMPSKVADWTRSIANQSIRCGFRVALYLYVRAIWATLLAFVVTVGFFMIVLVLILLPLSRRGSLSRGGTPVERKFLSLSELFGEDVVLDDHGVVFTKNGVQVGYVKAPGTVHRGDKIIGYMSDEGHVIKR